MSQASNQCWEFDRLSATGRNFLLEPQSRNDIVRELQQRLLHEQQRRNEQRQLLQPDSNAVETNVKEAAESQMPFLQSDTRISEQTLSPRHIQPTPPPPDPPPPCEAPSPKTSVPLAHQPQTLDDSLDATPQRAAIEGFVGAQNMQANMEHKNEPVLSDKINQQHPTVLSDNNIMTVNKAATNNLTASVGLTATDDKKILESEETKEQRDAKSLSKLANAVRTIQNFSSEQYYNVCSIKDSARVFRQAAERQEATIEKLHHRCDSNIGNRCLRKPEVTGLWNATSSIKPAAPPSGTGSMSVQGCNQVLVTPCLMCLMRSLQDSGLLGSSWSSAILQLQEAFTIKTLADAAFGQAPLESNSNQVLLQQPQLRQVQAPAGSSPSPSIVTEPISKWQALERLCFIRNSLKACTHTN